MQRLIDTPKEEHPYTLERYNDWEGRIDGLIEEIDEANHAKNTPPELRSNFGGAIQHLEIVRNILAGSWSMVLAIEEGERAAERTQESSQ